MPILLTISIWMWNVLKKETKYIEKQKKNLEKNGKKSYMLYVMLNCENAIQFILNCFSSFKRHNKKCSLICLLCYYVS